MFLRRLLAGLALLAAAADCSAAEKLVVLGTGTINPNEPGVSIDVRKVPGAYRGIRLRTASDGPADIKRIQIVYSDGTSYTHDKEFKLEGNERTRGLDERGDDRFIDQVIVTSQPTSDRTVIEILGIQSRTGARRSRPKPATGDLAAAPTSPKPSSAPAGSIVDGNDVMFGYQNVGLTLDRDTIKVGGDLGKFARLRLRVLGNAIHIDALKVNYVDGASEDIAVDADIKANSKSGWFELSGNGFIRDIQMIYRSEPNLKGQARVEVTGQFVDGWLGAEGEGRRYNEGWVLLGAQTAGFTGFDRDTITVGRNEGGFVRLRISARERAITLREVRVKFVEGPDEVFSMNERVDAGQNYGPLEFKSGKTPIKAIEAKYRSRFDILKGLKTALDTSPAVVEFWAQH